MAGRAGANTTTALAAPKAVSAELVPAGHQTSYGHFLSRYEEAERLATVIAKSGVYDNLRQPHQVLAVAAVGASLGISLPMAALNIYTFAKKPTMAAHFMKALIQRDMPGVKIKVVKESDAEVELLFSHPSCDDYTSRWTIKDAERAELAGKDNWRKYPRKMLMARALADGCRYFAPGVLAGFYTPEELADEDDDGKGGDSETATVHRPAKATVVQPEGDIAISRGELIDILQAGAEKFGKPVDDVIDVEMESLVGFRPEETKAKSEPVVQAMPTAPAADLSPYANGAPVPSGTRMENGHPVGASDPCPTPESAAASEGQIMAITGLKKKLNITDRVEWLSMVHSVGGEHCRTARDLSEVNASKFVKLLQAKANAPTPAAEAAAAGASSGN